MKIDKIEVSNFKCFERAKLEFENFNVIIGKNASGKSNVISIIKFIRDMLIYGIDDAIALQGGIKYLCNSNIKDKEPIRIKFSVDTYNEETFRKLNIVKLAEDSLIMLEKYEITLEIKAHKRGSGYKIIENKAEMHYVELKPKKGNENKIDTIFDELDNYKKTNRFIQVCYVQDGKIIEQFEGKYDEKVIQRLEIKSEYNLSKIFNEEGKNLLLISYIPRLVLFQIIDGEKIKIYDFDPKTLKSASIINRKNFLEEDGSNISNVLERILRNAEEKRNLLLILKRLLPFIQDISTEKSFNKSMYFRLKENNKNDLPSSLLSDGTVNIIAIIIALYFEKENDIVIIEEPEKNMHPKLANQLVTLMKDVGHKKQVIITTHNTQLLSSVDLKDIFYVYRNKEKYSEVEKPEKNEKVKVFIKNELDIGDLFYEGLFTEKEE